MSQKNAMPKTAVPQAVESISSQRNRPGTASEGAASARGSPGFQVMRD